MNIVSTLQFLQATNKENSYHFSGIAAKFTCHRQAVTALKFANNHTYLFASASLDGQIAIGVVFPEEIKHMLSGHTKGVTDIEWSSGNDFLLSTSLDTTIRLWDVKTGDCIRIVEDSSETLCCCFCPVNNNLFVVSVHQYDVSRALVVKCLVVRIKMTYYQTMRYRNS